MGLIKAKNLTYSYPGSTLNALEDVSITINEGAFVILTGPSGCGKTTLCRCFNGLIPHFYSGKLEGELEVAGLKVVEHPICELAQYVGLVFQNPENQLFALSVEKDVAFGLENLGTPREEIKKRVEWALRITGIKDLSDASPHDLSGGEQQRVAIASVLAMQPDVMMLDEPTSCLDPLGAKKILEVISDLNKKIGITVILVEHRMDVVSRFADRVIVMREGKVVLDGEPREIFDSEEARLIGVGIPQSVRIYQFLKKRGIRLKEVPLSSKEASQFLREALA